MTTIRIKTQSGSLSNERIKLAFRHVFKEEPEAIRAESRSLVIYTSQELNEKKVRRFAAKIGVFIHFKAEKNSYSFMI